MHPKQNILKHKMNPNKLKSGLVVSYDLPPGNRDGLFWFQCFINLLLTYLLTHLLTTPGPAWGYELNIKWNTI